MWLVQARSDRAPHRHRAGRSQHLHGEAGAPRSQLPAGVLKGANVSTQDRVFDFLKSYVAEHGHGPKVREVCEAVGLSSTGSVQAHLRALRADGRITWEKGKPRTLTVSEG